MTNEEAINKTLDKVIELDKRENIRILASRMINDIEFTADLFAFIATLCTIHPSLYEEISKRIALNIMEIVSQKDEENNK